MLLVADLLAFPLRKAFLDGIRYPMLALYCLDILDVAQDHTRYTAANLKVYNNKFSKPLLFFIGILIRRYPMGLIVDETEVYVYL